MARVHSFHFEPASSRAKLLAFLSFLLIASPCDAQELLKLDDSVGRDLLFKFPEESIGEIWNGEYAEKAREDWNAVRKALDADSKEGFEKAVAKFKDLQESAETRCDTVDDACARYREDHQDAFKHREKGKVTDDDVDVLIQDKKFTEWQGRVLRDYKAITNLRELVEGHTWLQWEEFWAQKKAWEDRHPGQAMLAKRTAGEQRFFVDGNGGVHDKNPEKAENPPGNAKKEAQTETPPPALAPADVIKKEARTELQPPTLAPADVVKPATDPKTKKTDEKTLGSKMSMSDGSLGGDLFFNGYPEELIGGIKSDDFAESARKAWDAVSKALDKGSKEDFDKAIAKIWFLNEVADGRYRSYSRELGEYGLQHIDALERLEKGKITDDDVDVLKRYKELETRKQQTADDFHRIERFKKLADHSWKEWSEFWERKQAWEKEHPGKNMLGKRGKDWPSDEANKNREKPRKPAQTETKKTKSAKKRGRVKEEEASTDPAAVEIGVGIATSILGGQLGGHHGHSRGEHRDGHASGTKQTTSSRKTTTRKTTKSGTTSGGSSGTTMNTTVGVPTITFGRGF